MSAAVPQRLKWYEWYHAAKRESRGEWGEWSVEPPGHETMTNF